MSDLLPILERPLKPLRFQSRITALIAGGGLKAMLVGLADGTWWRVQPLSHGRKSRFRIKRARNIERLERARRERVK